MWEIFSNFWRDNFLWEIFSNFWRHNFCERFFAIFGGIILWEIFSNFWRDNFLKDFRRRETGLPTHYRHSVWYSPYEHSTKLQNFHLWVSKFTSPFPVNFKGEYIFIHAKYWRVFYKIFVVYGCLLQFINLTLTE